MFSQEQQDELERKSAERLVGEIPMPPGVERVGVELGEDWTGDPAMWLVFRLTGTTRLEDDEARLLNEYASSLQSMILHSGLRRFPYTRWETAA